MVSPRDPILRRAIRSGDDFPPTSPIVTRSWSPPRTSPSPSRLSNSLHSIAKPPTGPLRQVASCLREQLTFVHEVEQAKIDLAVRTSLNLALLFQFCDRGGKEYVTAGDLHDLCHNVGLSVTTTDLHTMLQEVAGGTEMLRLRFGDFIELFVAHHAPEYRQLQMNRFAQQYRAVDFELSVDERYHVRRLLAAQVDGAVTLRRHIRQLTTFEVKEAFRTLDTDYDGYVSTEDLKQGLADIGISLSERDLLILLKAYDHHADGRISSVQFNAKLAPHT